MKILGKILALLLVGLGLLSAIAVFYETQVSIPETPPESNPHVDYLKRHSMAILGLDIDGKISETDPAKHLKDDSLENEYQKQLLSLRRFYDEKQISDSDYNHQIDTFALCYSEALISKAQKLFKDRTWPSDERSFLTKRVSELNALSNIDNNNVLASHSSLKSRIDAITTSCVDYVQAENLLSHSSYTSVYSAQNNIQEADALIEKGSLNLNTALIEELRSYPNKIGDSHLQLIKDLADGISNWRNNSLTTTVSRYERLISEADAYSSNGSIYKGEHPYSVSQIRSNATSNKNQAVEELSTLYVDGYSSDVTRSLSSYSGSLTLSISTNYPGGYTLQDTSSQWFSISSKNSSSVTVSYNGNSSYEDRSDYFTVKAGKKSIKVTLNQSGATNYGSLDRGYVNANSYSDWNSQQSSGRYVTVSVESDGYCDLDLIITDRNGNQLGKDEAATKNASVRFYTSYTGLYYIRVKNCTGRGCNYSLRVQ